MADDSSDTPDSLKANIASWASSQEIHSSQVAQALADIDDPRVTLCVALQATGKRGSDVWRTAGCSDRVVYWRLRQRYPIDAMAAAESEARARGALMRLSNKLNAAADVVCDMVDGHIDEGHIKAEQLRLKAATTVIGTMMKVIERAADNASGSKSKRGTEISTDELMRRAMEIKNGASTAMVTVPSSKPATVIDVPDEET